MSKGIIVIFEIHDNKFDSAFEIDLNKDFLEFMKRKNLSWRESTMEPVKKLENGTYKWKTTFRFNEIKS